MYDCPGLASKRACAAGGFHEWLGDSWGVLFSHPKDFTPVCTTELGYMAGLQPEFEKRNCKIIGLSIDPVADHGRWAADIEKTQGNTVTMVLHQAHDGVGNLAHQVAAKVRRLEVQREGDLAQ